MNNVETLQRFARFQAARAATDFLDIDVAGTLSEASTDPYVLRQLWLPPISVSMEARDSTPSASADILSAPDETPVSDFDVLDDLRTPKGRFRGKSRRFEEAAGCPTASVWRAGWILCWSRPKRKRRLGRRALPILCDSCFSSCKPRLISGARRSPSHLQ